MMYLKNDPRNYPNPTDKALAMARQVKVNQRTTPEHYREFYGKEAPAWMFATAEDIARHIDLVHWASVIHGVQLKWEQVEYGLSFEQIEQIAIGKQSYRYQIGDYLPREATTEAVVGDCVIRGYFGTYYICRSDMVHGVYRDDYGNLRLTNNNLTQKDVIAVRFVSLDEAIRVSGQVIVSTPENFVDYLISLTQP